MIPASYAARWIALLDARGVSGERALAGTGITLATLDDPNARLTIPALVQVITIGAELAGDPSLGLELGLALKPTAHSWFGIAVMTASTLGEAIELGARYLAVRLSPWRIHLFREGERGIMQFDQAYDLGPARLLILECLLGAVIRMGEFLRGHSYAHPDIEFYADYPEPAYHARFRDQLPRVHYASSKLQARFPAEWLDRPLSLAEPHAYREAVAVLDHEMHLIGETDDWLARTRGLLEQPGDGYLDLDAVASALAVSTRTLRRHLQARGTTFHELRDEARRTRAITLLELSRISLGAIARELGYADAAGFTRAFQRWTGEPPNRYRQRRAARAQ